MYCLQIASYSDLFNFLSYSVHSLGYRKMNLKKMLKSYNRVNHIIGETGQSLEEETACIYGVMLQLWSYQMVAMDGSDLSWMGNWLQCILVEVLKEDLTVLVQSIIFLCI